MIVAMLVSVAYAGPGIAIAKPVPKAVPEVSAQDIVSASVPSESEQPGGKMAPTDKKPTTTSSVLLATAVGHSTNDGTRTYSQPLFDGHRVIALAVRPVAGRLPHSTSMISSSLGRQFTLIGAKPDGTM